MVDTVIFDLDGVIRDWNDDLMAELEIAHGLAAGTILTIGFGPALGPEVVTGRITYEQWVEAIGEVLVDENGSDSAGALREWALNVGTVNSAMLQVLRTVRDHARVALLSNGTSRLRDDLKVLGLSEEFDVVFNTAELGVAKPSPEVFHTVLDRLGTTSDDVLFIDDLQHNVTGALAVGITAHLHTDIASTVGFLDLHGIPAGQP